MTTSIKDNNYTLQEKLQILADAAKYDVACTSSGSSRRGKKGELGNTEACGICHSFAADGRCISLLKILMTNHCAYDCKYCINRVSNDVRRATFTPQFKNISDKSSTVKNIQDVFSQKENDMTSRILTWENACQLAPLDMSDLKRSFAPAGQSTQMIIGSDICQSSGTAK